MTRRSDVLIGVTSLCIAAAGAILLIAFNRARQPVATQTIEHITAPSFGCQSLATANQIGTLLSQHDEEAADQVIRQGLANGDCMEFNVGMPIYVGNQQPSGLIQARPKGDPNTYWTVSNAIGP